jgi:hypothetical protein
MRTSLALRALRALRVIREGRGTWRAMRQLVAVVSGAGYVIHRKFQGLICWTLNLLGHFLDQDNRPYI